MSAQESLEPPHETIERLAAENDRLTRGIELLAVDLENANVELAVKRRQITQLRHEIEGRVKAGDQGPLVEAAFAYWQKACGHPRARLDHKRAKAIETMLRHRAEAGEDALLEVMRAIDGARFDAFVDEKGKKHDGIALICRDEDSFDRMRDRWRATIEHGKLSAALNAYCLPAGESSAALSFEHGGWRWKCPVCALRCDVGRKAWEQDVLWLTVGRGFVFCSGACVGLTVEMIRGALLEGFPLVPA